MLAFVGIFVTAIAYYKSALVCAEKAKKPAECIAAL